MSVKEIIGGKKVLTHILLRLNGKFRSHAHRQGGLGSIWERHLYRWFGLILCSESVIGEETSE